MLVDNGSVQARVVVIGNSAVGKTSILNQLIARTFNEQEVATIGANYQVHVEDVDGSSVELQIWDTAGQEKFRALGPIYFRNARGAIVVYDVADRSTFDALESWIASFRDVAGPETVVVVVGNKCDVEDGVAVSEVEGEKWAADAGFSCFRTSAKTGKGIKETFHELAVQLLQRRIRRNGVQRALTEQKSGVCAC